MIRRLHNLLAATLLAFAAAGLLSASVAVAQDYPNKPIRFVLGQPAGGPTDIVARLIGQKLGDRHSGRANARRRAR